MVSRPTLTAVSASISTPVRPSVSTVTVMAMPQPVASVSYSALTWVGAEFETDATGCGIAITVTVETLGRTGVEMEALTAVSVGLLTIYDMCKAVDRGMRIEGVLLLEKKGGKSGHYVNPDAK